MGGKSTGDPVGAAVVDWDRDEPLPMALARTLRVGAVMGGESTGVRT